jgi:hypothetical protein
MFLARSSGTGTAGSVTVMTQLLPNNFDRSKPFYPLVVNYLTLLVGFKELGLRGVTGPQEFETLINRSPALGVVPPGSKATAATVREHLRTLSGPLKLKSEFSNDHIVINIDELAHEVVSNFSFLASVVMRSAGSLLILAHEISKEEPWHDQGELWEFLRHCRNASAHGGRFNLSYKEPRCAARWGKLEITKSLQGMWLFKDAQGSGLLSPGDPIRLLWDIEQAYPQMQSRMDHPKP